MPLMKKRGTQVHLNWRQKTKDVIHGPRVLASGEREGERERETLTEREEREGRRERDEEREKEIWNTGTAGYMCSRRRKGQFNIQRCDFYTVNPQ